MLITISALLPINSMLRLLLIISASLLVLAGYSQNAVPDPVSPSEVVTEDPNRAIGPLQLAADPSRVTVSWKVEDGKMPDFFAIERSENGKTFQTIAVLNTPLPKPLFQWIDEAPRKGECFYRIRYAGQEGQTLYSATASVVVTGRINIKFYPNPVDHILIVRSEMPLDVQIADANGRIRVSSNRPENLHTLNVSGLEKGIYVIRFINKLTNIISQEKLVKN